MSNATAPTEAPSTAPKRIIPPSRRRKPSAAQAKSIRRWAKGLLKAGDTAGAVRYLSERKLGLWELPETHHLPLPKRKGRGVAHNGPLNIIGIVHGLGHANEGTPGGEGVASPGLLGNANITNPAARNFQSLRNYDPASEPTFEDRPEGSYEPGVAVPIVNESALQRSWVGEIPELAAAFEVKPKAPVDAKQVWDESQQTYANVEAYAKALKDEVGPVTFAGVQDGLESQGNALSEPATPYETWPAECVLEILGACPNRFLVRVRVVGGEKLPDGGACSMWKRGRSWTEKARVRARIESPTGTIVYEPVD